jgi:hypothetical protein
MKKRHALLVGLAAGAGAALVAHAAYWYAPRERAAQPSEAVRARLAAEEWEQALWVPFPHQNVGLLERRVGDLRRWLELVAPEGSGTADRLPTFGPWALPPARELFVAQRGEALEVDLAVFPTVALLARASGRLAGNPWLAGGEVDLGRGRSGTVEWMAGRWRLTSSPPPARREVPPAAMAGDEAPALARLRLARPIGQLPAGAYRLVRQPDGLALLAGRPPAAAPPLLGETEPRPAGWLVERPGRRGVAATVIWPDEGPMPPFPAAVTLDRGGARRRRVPGEELLRLAGGEPRRELAGGFTLRALSEAELERGRPLAAELQALLATRPGLDLYAGARPDALALAARRLANRFAGLPIGRLLGSSPERLEAQLAPLRGCGATALEVWERPPAVRWRVCLAEPPGALAAP